MYAYILLYFTQDIERTLFSMQIDPNQPQKQPWIPSNSNQQLPPLYPDQQHISTAPGSFQPMQPPPPSFQPVQPPAPKKKRRFGNIVWIIVVIVAFFIGTAVGHGGTATTANTGTTNNNTTTHTGGTTTAKSTTAPATSQSFKVGDNVTVGTTWKISVNGIATNPGDQFNTPQNGQFVVVDVTMTNISSSEQTVSSLVNFQMRGSDGTQYNETIVANLAGVSPAPDGKVEAGQPLKGDFVYDIATSVHNFTFSFTPDITSSGATVWNLSV
jgi:Domain of unknown function (DUF4352)